MLFSANAGCHLYLHTYAKKNMKQGRVWNSSFPSQFQFFTKPTGKL